ncbi:MAG: alpha/beta fold hydrolase [Micrococcales bacterium]|nr:alpha/beta fold hydrolase [Micrococcales bacterium]MCL2666329.1 alpha/beta fold hydrolase [Micrococcales bacterium]
MHHRLIRPAAAATLAAALSIGLATSAVAAPVDPNPRQPRPFRLSEDASFPAALATSLLRPTANPPLTNNWSCKPSAEHPEPVILIHGTWENAYDNWAGLGPVIADQGYCVFALNYGNTTGLRAFNATGDMVASNQEIAAFVAQVRTATGAEHVALVGHSQGGAQARYYSNLAAPEGEVTKVIMLTPSNHATTLSGITILGDLLGLKQFGFTVLQLLRMPAAVQQASPDAPFYVNLNGNGETRPGIDYTVIASKYDEIVTPYRQAFITAGPGATVDNITLQSVCSKDLSEHLSVNYSKNVAQIILNKLDPENQHAIKCYSQAPLVGSLR